MGLSLSAFAGGLVVALAFACGDPLPDAPPADGGAQSDATSPGADGASSSSSGGSASCLPEGAFIIGPGEVACPGGTTAKVVQSNPQPQSGACTCGCTITNQGTCNGNNLLWEWGPDDCNPSQESFTFSPPDCFVRYTNGPVGLAAFNRWPTITPSAGTCTAPAAAHADKVTTTPVRQCLPNAGACVTPFAGDRVCVPADAGAACSGTYSVALVVGDSANVQCAACTTCATTGAVCTIEYHGNSTCTNKVYERAANGQCMATGSPQTEAFKLVAKGATCNATPGTATAGMNGAKNYCCTP